MTPRARAGGRSRRQVTRTETRTLQVRTVKKNARRRREVPASPAPERFLYRGHLVAHAPARGQWEIRAGRQVLAAVQYPEDARLVIDAMLAAVRRNPARRRVRRNPAPGAAVRQAQRAYSDFRGEPPRELRRVRLPAKPGALWTLGECLGIMYRTRRDGQSEDYLHRFKKSARPTLAVSHDGRQLYLLGGAYSVTDRGIEDDARRKR